MIKSYAYVYKKNKIEHNEEILREIRTRIMIEIQNIIPTSLLLSSAQKLTHYAQYYAHNYCNYATVHMQFYYCECMVTLTYVRS